MRGRSIPKLCLKFWTTLHMLPPSPLYLSMYILPKCNCQKWHCHSCRSPYETSSWIFSFVTRKYVAHSHKMVLYNYFYFSSNSLSWKACLAHLRLFNNLAPKNFQMPLGAVGININIYICGFWTFKMKCTQCGLVDKQPSRATNSFWLGSESFEYDEIMAWQSMTRTI